MKVFVTGAAGFIGQAVLAELKKQGGYEVIALARSQANIDLFRKQGTEYIEGGLTDLKALAQGAKESDAIIHLAFDNTTIGTPKFAQAAEDELNAVKTLANAIKGTNKPLIVTSGLLSGTPSNDEPAREDYLNTEAVNPRVGVERLVESLAQDKLNVKVVRLGQIHSTKAQGLFTYIVPLGLHKGEIVYGAESKDRKIAACSVQDAAKLYVLALKHGDPGQRFHACAENGTLQEYITAIGKAANLKVRAVTTEELDQFYGPLSFVFKVNLWASNEITRRKFGWVPTGPSLIESFQGVDFAAVKADPVFRERLHLT